MIISARLPAGPSSVAIFTFILLLTGCHLLVVSDNLPLLSGILRTYQTNACDTEDLKLECDRRTVISIVVAQYGQPAQPHMCRKLIHQPQADADPGVTAGKPRRGNASGQPKCHDADRLRYNFLKKVERTCRDQYQCNVTLTPQNLDLAVDPCAEHIKYAEVAYKCRPKLFKNKYICENNSTRLFCQDPDDRVVIFSAFFGSRADEVLECPQWPTGQPGVRSNQSLVACEMSFATEYVMSLCHGKRECTVSADTNTFGMPSCPSRQARPRFHLKVVYTCMTKKVLKPMRTTTTTTTTTSTTTTTTAAPVTTQQVPSTSIRDNRLVDDDVQSTEKSPYSTVSNADPTDTDDPERHSNHTKDDHEPNTHLLMDSVNSGVHSHTLGTDARQHNPHANCSQLPASMQVIGFVSDWISAVGFIKKNKERLILYLLVSLFGSLVCFLLVLSVKLYQQKNRTKRKAREEQPPVTPFEIMDFDDDLDDLDGMPVGPMDTGTYMGPSHRHFSYHVPQDTPSVSILGGSATEPRPLLYSTLRKKPALKTTSQYNSVGKEPWATSSRTSASRLIHPTIIDYNSQMATMPKSILTNRNSTGSGILKPATVEASTNTTDEPLNGFATVRHTPTTTVTCYEDSGFGPGEVDHHTEPKSLSKSLNNFFM